MTLLSEEWQRRKECLESKLACSVEQCKILAINLNKTTENLRARKIQSFEKETKLIQENEELQWKYDRKLHQLQEALQKMQEEFSTKVCTLNNIKNLIDAFCNFIRNFLIVAVDEYGGTKSQSSLSDRIFKRKKW